MIPPCSTVFWEAKRATSLLIPNRDLALVDKMESTGILTSEEYPRPVVHPARSFPGSPRIFINKFSTRLQTECPKDHEIQQNERISAVEAKTAV